MRSSNVALGAQGRSRAHVLALLALILLITAVPLHAAPQVPARPPRAQADLCTQITAVPAGECAALAALYNTTGGPNWLKRAGWLAISPAAPCDWFGVVCAGGRVVELNLPKNRLKGALPGSLDNLTALRRLTLNGNYLQGAIPHSICTLTDTVTMADLSYNALFTAWQTTRDCLNQLDPDWAATQTTIVRDGQFAGFETNAVQMSWTPIPYTTNGGFYEVSYATTFDGPYVTHGRTANKQASGYRVGGLASGTTYHLRVQTVTPPHAGNPTEVRSDFTRAIAVTRSSQSILLMIYFPADNDLAPYVPSIVERVRFGTQFNPNVRVVMLSDRAGVEDTQVVTIAGGVVTATDAVFTRWGKRELDTADPQVLSWFLRYARETYRADREIVSLMGHGVALAPEVEWPDSGQGGAGGPAEPRNGIPPLTPKGAEATPGDITDGGYMSTVDLGQALAAATDSGARPFELIFFDQCFQGNLDSLYEVRTAADFFIASPNYAWLVAPYAQYLALLAPASSTEQIVEGIINRYQSSLNDRHPNVIFGLRRADIEAVATAVSGLGDALARAARAGGRPAIIQAVRDSLYVDTTQCGEQNLTLGPPDELIGIGTFVQNLYNAFPAGDPHGVHAAAESVGAALQPIHKSTRVGSPYLAPGEHWDYSNTLTMLAPLPPDSPADVAWRSTIYTETVPLTATWTPMPTMTVVVTASFAYVRDGSWDEFLAGWYNVPRPPTVGEWCHYIPPAVVGGAELEPLELEVAEAESPALELTWSATTHQDAASYWLYVWPPEGVGWVAHLSVPLDQTSAVITDLLPGEHYRFLLVAQDAAGVAVAESNEAEWTTDLGVLLPLVER